MSFRSSGPKQWPPRANPSRLLLHLLAARAHPNRLWREAQYYPCQSNEHYPMQRLPIDPPLRLDSINPTRHQTEPRNRLRLFSFRLLLAKMGKGVARHQATHRVYHISPAARWLRVASSNFLECRPVSKKLLQLYLLRSRLELMLRFRLLWHCLHRR